MKIILISLFALLLFSAQAQDSLSVKSDTIQIILTDSISLDSIFKTEIIPVEKIRVEDINLDKYFDESSQKKPDTIDPTKLSPVEKVIKAEDYTSFPKKRNDSETSKGIIPESSSVVSDSVLFVRKPFEPVLLDSIDHARNPLFSELVYKGKEFDLDWRKNDTETLFYGAKRKTLDDFFDPVEIRHPAETLVELREDAREFISQTAPGLYRITVDRLPKIDWEKQHQVVEANPLERLRLEEDYHVPVVSTNRIIVRKKKISPWQGKANALLQFSQTAISENWYKGGNDFFSLLGALSGNINYDNKKKIKWENSFEWRTGFNTVTGDTIGSKGGRKTMPSDDIFKINSKFGLKATGDFYYSTSLEFQTQLFDNPAGINNYEMKARFLTPIRLNIGVGMDYKHKKLSIALSPLSFKYIYLTDTVPTPDGFYINPNSFGIKKGENQLKEIGSKLIVELKDYRPFSELKLNSRFIFYTNYEKVEVDWEIVAELAFNRFFSTRLMLNPRFDNTVILEGKEKARIQMKEMLTVGFSYRLF